MQPVKGTLQNFLCWICLLMRNRPKNLTGLEEAKCHSYNFYCIAPEPAIGQLPKH